MIQAEIRSLELGLVVSISEATRSLDLDRAESSTHTHAVRGRAELYLHDGE